MNLNDEASPLTADATDEVFEVDDLIREAMDADDVRAWEEGLDDPAVLAERLDTLKGIVWDQEARIRRLQARLDEPLGMDTERGMLTQRIQSSERNFESFRKVLTDKEKRIEQDLAKDPSARAQHMKAWQFRSLVKAREEAIEAMLEGGERFERMSHIHIQEYGDNKLDYPPLDRAIERPDFIVLEALPDVLRQAFMEQFAPVASLIREDETPHLSLARFEDWQAFAKTFA
jgi:hypothetical protein